MYKTKKLRKGLQTGLIILAIYGLFILYLLFVSERVEKLDNKSSDDYTYYSLKVGE